MFTPGPHRKGFLKVIFKYMMSAFFSIQKKGDQGASATSHLFFRRARHDHGCQFLTPWGRFKKGEGILNLLCYAVFVKTGVCILQPIHKILSTMLGLWHLTKFSLPIALQRELHWHSRDWALLLAIFFTTPIHFLLFFRDFEFPEQQYAINICTVFANMNIEIL